MVSFFGWQMPLFYTSIIDEHKHCRMYAAIFDVSHMGEFVFQGDIKDSGLEPIFPCSLSKIPVGKASYTFILNQKGGIIDDLIILRLGEDRLMFVVNAASRLKDYKILKENLKSGSLEDISDQTVKIDIQGPLARELLMDFFSCINNISYFSFSQSTYRKSDVIISRTGYTGELGYEIFVPDGLASFIWQELLLCNKIKPAGIGARDILRIEMGYNLLGYDLTENITPLEAGLGRFIDFDKDFIGKEPLLVQRDRGVDKIRIAFSTGPGKIPRPGYRIYSDNKRIGDVTSGTFSSLLSTGIGLGYAALESEKKIEIEDARGARFEAEIVDLPFYKKGSLKN